MLTRIRNANDAKHATVDIPASNMKKAIAEILVNEGYVSAFETIEDGKQGIIRVTLKYTGKKQKVLRGIRRVSKPGLRIYAGCEEMPRVMNGLGIAIVSTSKGIMTDKQARKEKVGGEVLAFVW
jgi:small subunit ribosomal protein S8